MTSSIAERVRELTRPTGEEDLLDVRYPAPRLRISARHAIAVAAVSALGLLMFFLLRPAPAPPTAPVFVSPTATSGAEVVVSVVGAVEKPQLVTLAPGARLADALSPARPLPDAELAGLNLAQKLTDGAQIHVPRKGEAAEPVPGSGSAAGSGAGSEPGAAGAAAVTGGKISLNSANAAELTELPGVGPKTAEAIIAHRQAIGSFTAIEQLQDVKGIGPAKFEKMKDRVAL